MSAFAGGADDVSLAVALLASNCRERCRVLLHRQYQCEI